MAPENAAFAADAPVLAALAQARDGGALGRDGAIALLATPSLTDALLAAASARRDRVWGRTVTFSPKVFLPVTNLCRDRCTYCTFRKDPDDPDAWTMQLDEIAAWSRRGRGLGCAEALMCLGDKPEVAFPAYRALLAEWGYATTAAYVERACEVALEHGLLPHYERRHPDARRDGAPPAVNVSLGLMLENVSPRPSRPRRSPPVGAPTRSRPSASACCARPASSRSPSPPAS
jgi:FO synthase